MFTYIKVKNFKSLVDLRVNLTSKKDTPKKVALIYGENGVGKSNLVSIFVALTELISTSSVSYALNKIISDIEKKDFPDGMLNSLKLQLKDDFKDVESIINTYKTVNSDGNMMIEVGFKIDDKVGMYRVETNDTSIVGEYLEYVMEKNKTTYFSLSDKKQNINEGIFKRKTYSKEFYDLVEKYWGKHSLLSIINEQIRDKNLTFINQVFNEGILSVVNYFKAICVHIKYGSSEIIRLDTSHEILIQLQSGKVKISDEDKLNRAESFLSEFFTHLYSDVKDVFYKRTITDKVIEYELYFRKQIYGKILDIPFSNESTGTHKLLRLLPVFIACVEGRTVIIDEFDTGIHDILLSKLFNNFLVSAKGQIIITTHNTMLLDSDIPKQSIYIFDVDSHGIKKVIPISSLERAHPNQSIRKRYLEGLYGGVPNTMNIDFDDLLDILAD